MLLSCFFAYYYTSLGHLLCIRNGIEISFHHRVTQSFTEFYSFDFKLIKLCETLCYSVVN
ncbi:hypothetical protein DWW88_09565 [Bacteroides cellulosilyticus]|nr:hypothetical protein DWW88_09565 [Bacteroides cellulosilyticus]